MDMHDSAVAATRQPRPRAAAMALAARLDAMPCTDANEAMFEALHDIDGTDGCGTFVENLRHHFQWVEDKLLDDNPRMVTPQTYWQPAEWNDGAETAIEEAQDEAASIWINEARAAMAASGGTP